MSAATDTFTQVEHLVQWVEAKACPKNFDSSFIEAMEAEGSGWTGVMEAAIDNIYTKFRVGQWVVKNSIPDIQPWRHRGCSRFD